MDKLYRKSELAFSLVWIGLYVVLFSLTDGLSEKIGMPKLITALLGIMLSVFLFLWAQKNKLLEAYGLVNKHFSRKVYLWFLPLIFLASANFWNGVKINFPFFETVCYMVSMVCVGFLEELIFRGFLFKSMCRNNVKAAIIVSSVTFGMGHIINLLGGAEFLPTLMQIIYAAAAGFLFTVIFYRSGSLVPCIITHSVLNAMSAFQREEPIFLQGIFSLVLTAVPLLYAFWILKKTKKAA